jgi:MYXO-CTERM domain-containing protein
VSGTCQAGTNPCPNGRCHEGLDKCEDWWEEKDVRGGGCQCGTSGASGAGLLLLLLGLAVLRLRPRG